MDVREKIEEILRGLVPGINLSAKNLMDEEGVESLTMIHLISELDIAFDIEITFGDIEENNLQSVDAIEKMVRAYLQ